MLPILFTSPARPEDVKENKENCLSEKIKKIVFSIKNFYSWINKKKNPEEKISFLLFDYFRYLGFPPILTTP